jgi:hypothetical protein
MDKASEPCWEINEACMAKLDSEKTCAAYKQKKSCWEIDWKTVVDLCSSSEEKEGYGLWFWLCKGCRVYQRHRPEIDAKLSLLNSKT